MILLEPPRTPWDLRWKMLRVPVRVHPFFWLTALLLSYDKHVLFALVLLEIVCIFVSILVHEFGHALSQRYYGDRETYIVLYHFGGLAVGSHSPRGLWPKVAILLWGPGAGFVLGGVAYAVGAVLYDPAFAFGRWASADYLYVVLRVLVWINLAWGVMNLLPVFPLDGGQIMREVILIKRPNKGDPFAFQISCYVALLVTVLALVRMVLWPSGDLGSDLLPVVLFGVLAWQSHNLRQQLGQMGSLGDREPRREAWEQDPDWWKK